MICPHRIAVIAIIAEIARNVACQYSARRSGGFYDTSSATDSSGPQSSPRHQATQMPSSQSGKALYNDRTGSGSVARDGYYRSTANDPTQRRIRMATTDQNVKHASAEPGKKSTFRFNVSQGDSIREGRVQNARDSRCIRQLEGSRTHGHPGLTRISQRVTE